MVEIKLDGKTFPVRATMRAWRKFEEATGKKVAEVDSNDVTLIPELVYYFVQEGCKSQGMAFEMEVDDFFGMIEISDLATLSETVAKIMGGAQKNKSQGKPLSWDEIEEMGLGQLRLNPFSLYDMTFKEFGNAMAGHYKQIEEREKAEWERTRWLATITINPHVKKRLTPKDLATFPWEKKEKAADGISILRTLAK